VGRLTVALCAVFAVACVASCGQSGPKPGTVKDEAMRAGLAPSHFVQNTPDYFHDMDYNVAHGAPRSVLSPAEIQGRNMWLVWTGGNDHLWDRLTVDSLGSFDLLKTISSHPRMYYGRHNRFRYLGLINEPCFSEPTGPDPNRFGLWLDVRDPKCPPDPFADAETYKGVKIGARGTTVAVGSYYGEPTGVMGLRLFPNPDFDEKARRVWNSDLFYNEPTYYSDPKLVRPYRVGMACGFCHVGPNPIKPPADPENPAWENLSSLVGGQYFWWDRVFNWMGDKNAASVFYQALHVSRPGTLGHLARVDGQHQQSRTMNAVLPRRAHGAGEEVGQGDALRRRPQEQAVQRFSAGERSADGVLRGAEHDANAACVEGRVRFGRRARGAQPRLHQYRRVQRGVAPAFPSAARRHADLADSTRDGPGELRLLARHGNADAGHGAIPSRRWRAALPEGRPRRPRLSQHRRANARSGQSGLCRALRPMPLDQAAGSSGRPRSRERERTELPRGLERLLGVDEDGRVQSGDAAEGAGERLPGKQFPVDRAARAGHAARINSCSPLATNAIRNNIWDNFSSESYKSLPSAGTVKIRNPITGKEVDYSLPAGGRGFIRPASLVSLWSTAPFLQNNTVGPFEWNPSVEYRLRSFDKSIEEMLWRRSAPRTRCLPTRRPVGVIDRITVDSYLEVAEGHSHAAPASHSAHAKGVSIHRREGRSARIARSRRGCRSDSSPTWTCSVRICPRRNATSIGGN
jgi:hypothetical protein